MGRQGCLTAASTVVLLVTIAVLTKAYVFNSDDVGLQTVLHTWRPGRGNAQVGEDTFLLKAPLYLVAGGNLSICLRTEPLSWHRAVRGLRR